MPSIADRDLLDEPSPGSNGRVGLGRMALAPPTIVVA
jgi:hypothetical protein